MVPEPKQPSLAENFVLAVVGFPKFAIEWVVGLLIAIMTDLHIAALAVTGVLVGLAVGSVLVGLAAFFVAYSFSRIISYVANAIGTGFGRLADATFHGLTAPPRQVVPEHEIVVEDAPPGA